MSLHIDNEIEVNGLEFPVVEAALRAYEVGAVRDIRNAGGTASPKWGVTTDRGKFLLRARPPDFANESSVRFDHAVLARLAKAGLPAPRPQPCAGGKTWTVVGSQMWELLSWCEGGSFVWKDERALAGVGRFLARFHQALDAPLPTGKEGWKREGHPDALTDLYDRMRRLAGSAAEKEGINNLGAQLDLIREQLDTGRYRRLPQTGIHGDVHPGNLGFYHSEVSAVYDFDYVSRHARLCDVVDGLMLFAAHTPMPLKPHDIRSLTQPFSLEQRRASIFLNAYQALQPLVDIEWDAFPLLIRSRWIQMRLRGSRKAPTGQKTAFVLDRFFEPIRWLDQDAPAFFMKLKQSQT